MPMEDLPEFDPSQIAIDPVALGLVPPPEPEAETPAPEPEADDPYRTKYEDTTRRLEDAQRKISEQGQQMSELRRLMDDITKQRNASPVVQTPTSSSTRRVPGSNEEFSWRSFLENDEATEDHAMTQQQPNTPPPDGWVTKEEAARIAQEQAQHVAQRFMQDQQESQQVLQEFAKEFPECVPYAAMIGHAINMDGRQMTGRDKVRDHASRVRGMIQQGALPNVAAQQQTQARQAPPAPGASGGQHNMWREAPSAQGMAGASHDNEFLQKELSDWTKERKAQAANKRIMGGVKGG